MFWPAVATDFSTSRRNFGAKAVGRCLPKAERAGQPNVGGLYLGSGPAATSRPPDTTTSAELHRRLEAFEIKRLDSAVAADSALELQDHIQTKGPLIPVRVLVEWRKGVG